MAGLLDFIGTPEGQGLLSAAFGGLAGARKGQPLNSLGRTGLAGLSGYTDAIDRQNTMAQMAQRNQLGALQLKQAQQAQDDREAERTLAAQSFRSPEQVAMAANGGPTNAAAAAAPNTQPSFDLNKYSTGLWKINPQAAGAFAVQQNALRPKFKEFKTGVDSATGKLTNYSVDEFGRSTAADFAPPPVIKTVNLGGTVRAYDENTLKPDTVFQATAAPDAVLSSNTSRANNADTIRGENLRAGYDASGNPTGDMETTAKAIASGQLPPPSGMALTNPKNQRILSRVMEINPSYDFTNVTAKKKAASDFTSGNLGNSMRSFATAGQHLDQLGELVDAMDNKNLQALNMAGNKVKQWTGNASVTNFDAAKDIVSKEVIKAIVGGGGGVSEREELSRQMSSAKSPAQLKGVINQYRNLMSAQHDNLLAQRRAAGLSDSTLPNYNGSATDAGVPLDVAAALKKHGG